MNDRTSDNATVDSWNHPNWATDEDWVRAAAELEAATGAEFLIGADLGNNLLEEQELIMQLSPLYLEKIQAAKHEGRQEGETIGEARMILRLLNRRLGSVSEQFSAQIQQLTTPQLEDLGEALPDFTSLADLETWLSQS